jgi:hypothetical protein
MAIPYYLIMFITYQKKKNDFKKTNEIEIEMEIIREKILNIQKDIKEELEKNIKDTKRLEEIYNQIKEDEIKLLINSKKEHINNLNKMLKESNDIYNDTFKEKDSKQELKDKLRRAKNKLKH